MASELSKKAIKRVKDLMAKVIEEEENKRAMRSLIEDVTKNMVKDSDEYSKMLPKDPELKVYRHYGSKDFQAFKFENVKNRNWIKPLGGLWGSDVKAPRTWEDWCRDNDYKVEALETYFEFRLKEGARVLRIANDTELMLAQLTGNLRMTLDPFTRSLKTIDFEALAEDFDAIEVYAGSDEKLWDRFYGWDCDSLLVLNKDSIVIEETP